MEQKKGKIYLFYLLLFFIIVAISICILQSQNKIKKIYIPQNLY